MRMPVLSENMPDLANGCLQPWHLRRDMGSE